MAIKRTLQKKFCFCLFFLHFSPFGVQAAEVDRQLLQSLNSEAGHDQARKKEFKADRKARKAFDNEREKELALFLEQQEKWEMTRERGLAEYRSRQQDKSPTDDGPEYKEDQKIKRQEYLKKEQARLSVVQTRQKITARQSPLDALQELEELNIDQTRPRFDLRKRGKNKWVGKDGKSNSGSSGSSGSSGFAPPPAAFDDFPQPEYMPAPMDNFEDIPPPPPPPINFDGSMGFGGVDSGFGDIPPPPPPPLDDDF